MDKNFEPFFTRPQKSCENFKFKKKLRKKKKCNLSVNDHRPYGERPPENVRIKLTREEKLIASVPFKDFRN
jgi:hypothetical protein